MKNLSGHVKDHEFKDGNKVVTDGCREADMVSGRAGVFTVGLMFIVWWLSFTLSGGGVALVQATEANEPVHAVEFKGCSEVWIVFEEDEPKTPFEVAIKVFNSDLYQTERVFKTISESDTEFIQGHFDDKPIFKFNVHDHYDAHETDDHKILSVETDTSLYVGNLNNCNPFESVIPTVTLDAEPTTVKEGEKTLLSWDSEYAEKCYSDDFTTNDKTSGTTTVSLTETTTFTVTCESETGHEKSASVKVNVDVDPDHLCVFEEKEGRTIVYFDPDDYRLRSDHLESAGYHYTGPVHENIPSGKYKVSLMSHDTDTKTQNYEQWFVILKDSHGNEIATSSAISNLPDGSSPRTLEEVVDQELYISEDVSKIYAWHKWFPNSQTGATSANSVDAVCAAFDVVEKDPIIPKVDIKAEPTTVKEGENTLLSWDSEDAEKCYSDDFTTNDKTSGTTTVALDQTTTFTVTCESVTGHEKSASVTVYVDVTDPEKCLAPDNLGDIEKITFGSTHPSERTLQKIFDDESMGIDSYDDQKNYQVWHADKNTAVKFTVEFLAAYAANSNVFGYYVDGDINTFEPIFKNKQHSDFPDVHIASPGDSVSVEVYGAEKIAFALHTKDSSEVNNVWATENGLNVDDKRHAVVYEGEGFEEYIVAFEDLKYLGDADFNDMVVKVTVDECPLEAPITPTVTIDAKPTTVKEGEETLLTWTSDNAVSCVGQNFETNSATSGTTTVALTQTTTFTVTCESKTGHKKSASVKVNVKDVPPTPKEYATVVAHKIVCTDESEMPNFGPGGHDETIDKNTAQEWVDKYDSCEFADSWKFQWAPEGTPNPDDPPYDPLYGEAGDPWKTFGPTVDGKATVQLTESDIDGMNYIWVREVLKEGYIPFTYGPNNKTNADSHSAEMYCHTDVLNYDNYDRVDDIAVDNTYYCVAWNMAIDPVTPIIPTVSIDAEPTTVDQGEQTLITWDSDNAVSCVGQNFNTGGETSGTTTVALTQTTTFTVTCESKTGHKKSASVKVNVEKVDDPFVWISADPMTVNKGGSTTLEWNSGNVDRCEGVKFDTEDETSGTKEVTNLQNTKTFTIKCFYGDDGEISDSVTVTVTTPTVTTTRRGSISGVTPFVPVVQLEITNERIEGVENESSVIVSWDTNMPASSQVVYGTESISESDIDMDSETFGYGNMTLEIENDLEEHYVGVIDLMPNQTYYFRPVSRTGDQQAIGEELSFTTPEGIVAPIVDCNYLRDYLHIKFDNDPAEVYKLQIFLNHFENIETPLTGVFDAITFNSVVIFQERYAEEILGPWGCSTGTGYVYITTRRHINQIVCQQEIALTETERAIIREYRMLMDIISREGISLPLSREDASMIHEKFGRDATAFVREEDRKEEKTDDPYSIEGMRMNLGVINGEEDDEEDRGILASAISGAMELPANLEGGTKNFAIFVLTIFLMYLVTLLFVPNSKETPGSENLNFFRRTAIFSSLALVAVLASFAFSVEGLIVPMSVVLAISVIVVFFQIKSRERPINQELDLG